MNHPSSFAPDFPLGLRVADVKTSLLGWAAYMAVLTVYCTTYEVVVSGAAPDLAGSLAWVLREWAIWWLITPVALKALRGRDAGPDGRLVPYWHLGAVIIVATVAFRVAVDYLTEARGAGAIVIIYAPRYLAVVIALFLIWHFFLRKRRPALPAGAGRQAAPVEARPPRPATLLVSRGSDTCPVQIERIQYISAAGNYVEISSGNRRYLLRSTMKKVEELLPPAQFIRVHRSHIVNVNEIERIRTRPSGNGTVVLRCGRSLSISKRYRSRLLRSRHQAI